MLNKRRCRGSVYKTLLFILNRRTSVYTKQKEMHGLEDELHGTKPTLGGQQTTLGGQSLAAALVQDGNAVTGGGQFRYCFPLQI